jgi:hypothetical protein
MHTLPYFNIATCVATCLSALRDRLAENLRRRRSRADARRTAQAFERLDDRTLRDIGFCRADTGGIGVEHGRWHATLRRVIHVV